MKAYTAGLLQGKSYRVLQNHLTQALKAFDLSIPEWKLLGQLCDSGKSRVADLAKMLDVDPPHITALVNDLEKKLLVKKIPSVQDKREVHINITTKGIKVVEKTEPTIRQAMKRILKGISIPELMIYMRVLNAIVKNGQELK